MLGMSAIVDISVNGCQLMNECCVGVRCARKKRFQHICVFNWEGILIEVERQCVSDVNEDSVLKDKDKNKHKSWKMAFKWCVGEGMYVCVCVQDVKAACYCYCYAVISVDAARFPPCVW